MSEAHDKHIAVLDGLRAMAILLVMVGHAAGNQWVDRSKPFFPIGPFDLGGTLLNCGWGVELFFVLSGFLITGQLLDVFLGDRERYRSGLRRYFKRRFFRIAPAYYVVLTFVTLVFMSLSPAQQVYNWVWSYVAHVFFMHNFFYTRYWQVFWSLATEMQFYCAAPLFLFALLRITCPYKRCAAVVAAVVVLAFLRTMVVLHKPSFVHDYDGWFYSIRVIFPFSLDGLLGGMMANMLWRDEKIRRCLRQAHIKNFLFLSGLLLVALLLGGSPMETATDVFAKTFWLTFLAAGFCLTMLGLMAGSFGQTFFSSRILRHIATVSYSMYLVHLSLVQFVYNQVAWLAHTMHSPYIPFLAGLFLFVVVTTFVATLMYELIEKPCILWARK
jgi:peptidoglycan/LPS O-acetylase OafA/YrhL